MESIGNKLTNLFSGKVDMSDIKFTADSDEYHNAFLSHCIAAISMQSICGIEVDEAVKCITYGHKGCGIGAIYKDENSKS